MTPRTHHRTRLANPTGPAARLFQAVQRYTDGLHVAAEQLLGPQTVAELDQAEQFWAAPGSHQTPALIGEIAVWRAANGINPQDPRPTEGGGQLETLPALWKQHLDRHIARATYSLANARADERQARLTALSRSDDRQRAYQKAERRPSRPTAPGR